MIDSENKESQLNNEVDYDYEYDENNPYEEEYYEEEEYLLNSTKGFTAEDFLFFVPDADPIPHQLQQYSNKKSDYIQLDEKNYLELHYLDQIYPEYSHNAKHDFHSAKLKGEFDNIYKQRKEKEMHQKISMNGMISPEKADQNPVEIANKKKPEKLSRSEEELVKKIGRRAKINAYGNTAFNSILASQVLMDDCEYEKKHKNVKLFEDRLITFRPLSDNFSDILNMKPITRRNQVYFGMNPHSKKKVVSEGEQKHNRDTFSQDIPVKRDKIWNGIINKKLPIYVNHSSIIAAGGWFAPLDCSYPSKARYADRNIDNLSNLISEYSITTKSYIKPNTHYKKVGNADYQNNKNNMHSSYYVYTNNSQNIWDLVGTSYELNLPLSGDKQNSPDTFQKVKFSSNLVNDEDNHDGRENTPKQYHLKIHNEEVNKNKLNNHNQQKQGNDLGNSSATTNQNKIYNNNTYTINKPVNQDIRTDETGNNDSNIVYLDEKTKKTNLRKYNTSKKTDDDNESEEDKVLPNNNASIEKSIHTDRSNNISDKESAINSGIPSNDIDGENDDTETIVNEISNASKSSFDKLSNLRTLARSFSKQELQ